MGDNEIFDSNDFAVVPIISIKGKCQVLSFSEYKNVKVTSHVYYHKMKYISHRKKFVNPEKPGKSPRNTSF
jgi:hypothetical protein